MKSLDPRHRAHVACLTHAAGGAGEDRADREPSRRLGGHHPARGPDGEHAVRVTRAQQPFFETGQIRVHQRLQVRVQHGGREALELPIFGHHVGGAGHGQAGPLALRRVGHRVLVRRTQIGVKQADGDGLGSGCEGRVEGAVDRAHVERHQHGAVGVEPLCHLEPVLALDDGLRPHEVGHEERGDIALGAADLDQIAEARSGEDGDTCAAPLQHGVRADGGPVHHAPHVSTRDAEGVEAGQHGAGLLAAAGRYFRDDDAPGGLVDRGQIGEGSADVDPDEEHGRDDSRRAPRFAVKREARQRSRSAISDDLDVRLMAAGPNRRE